jgi:hypothetical protein
MMSLNGEFYATPGLESNASARRTRALRPIAAGRGSISFLVIESMRAKFLLGGSRPLALPLAGAKKGADESPDRPPDNT